MTPMIERIRHSLVSLHMARALETLDQTLSQLEKGEISAIEAIYALLAEELTLREGRRISVGPRTARLTPIKTLESFDFSFQPSLDRHRIMALAQLEFINRAEVLHFLGPPGTGKSHLATAFGVAAVKAGRSVYGHPLRYLRAARVAITSQQPFFPTCYGKEFTDRLFGLRKRAATGAHEFDTLCKALAIEHRLTPPKSPQTNGMVERFNGRIEEVLQSHHFRSGEELETTLHSDGTARDAGRRGQAVAARRWPGFTAPTWWSRWRVT